MKLSKKAMLVILLTLCIGSSAVADHSDFYDRERGDQQLGISFGVGNNQKLPRHTSVPHMTFNVVTFEFEHFISERTSIGCGLSYIGQTNKTENEAISVSADFTRYFYIHDRFSISHRFGVGIMHLRDRVKGQATRNNFNEHLDLGFHYATSSSTAISLRFMFYHASNGGILEPNGGITSTFVHLGHSWSR